MRKNLPISNLEASYPIDGNLLSFTDLHGNIKYANSDFVEVSGFSKNELVGQPHNIVRHPDMPSEAFGQLWADLKSNNSWMGIVKNRSKSGNYYWVDAYVTPIKKNGIISEYQSVRTKPNSEFVERAKNLYSSLLRGDQRLIKTPRISFLARIMSAIFIMNILSGSLASSMWAKSITPIALVSVLSALGSAVALFVLWRPMRKIIAQAGSVTSDAVAMYVYTGRTDDIGVIELAMKALQSETGGLVGRIADDASNLSSISKELIDAVRESNDSIDRLKSQSESVATAINEMSASAQEVAVNAGSAADAAAEAKKCSDEGRGLVLETEESISVLAKEIKSASSAIRKLESDSEGINAVIDVIRSVAEQTNLLALNAAIEAARAGEQGRGFAVVADEVRTLATRTHESTIEITSMIEQLQKGSKNAVLSIERATLQADIVVNKTGQTSETIRSTSVSIDSINDMSYQIATAVEEQSKVAEEIDMNISEVSGLAQELSDFSLTNSAVGGEIHALASDLKEVSNQFFMKLREKN